MSILSYHVGAEPGGSGSGRAGDGDVAMLRELGSKNGNRTENKKENVASERKAREKEMAPLLLSSLNLCPRRHISAGAG
jgi:hypothetical protein